MNDAERANYMEAIKGYYHEHLSYLPVNSLESGVEHDRLINIESSKTLREIEAETFDAVISRLINKEL